MSRFCVGAAPGTRTPQNLGAGRTSTVCKEKGVDFCLLIRQPTRFAATPPAFAENFNRTRPTNFVAGELFLKPAEAHHYCLHPCCAYLTFPVSTIPRPVLTPLRALPSLRS